MKEWLIVCLQDKEDDVKVGVKSTALRFGDDTKLWLTGFGTTSMGLLALSGLSADLGNSMNFTTVQFFFVIPNSIHILFYFVFLAVMIKGGNITHHWSLLQDT